jgi:predicted RNase H-like HicB family nuclease
MTYVTAKVPIILEQDEDVWVASCPALNNLSRMNERKQDAIRDITAAIDYYFEVHENG